METVNISVLGASGHAKVVIKIIEALSGKNISKVYDDDASIRHVFQYDVVTGIPSSINSSKCIIAIGDNAIRAKVAENKTLNVVEALVHPTAAICSSAKLNKGTVVMPNAVINVHAEIGEHCIVNSGAIVEHDVTLEDFVHISPNAVITGNVWVGEGTQIGAGASIIPGIRIGKWAIIGAGAVVIEDVPDGATVVGNPGKIIP